MKPNVAKCLVVSKVLVADGMVSDDERAFLAALMARWELTDAERQAVIDLEGLEDASAVVAQLPLAEREEVVALLVDAAGADGKLAPTEMSVIQKLTAALGV